MAEYDLVCDACGKPLEIDDAVVSWTAAAEGERGFALTHVAHMPASATERVEGRAVTAPNGFLSFVGDRLGKRVADPGPLRAILWGLSPFVMRPDNATEMDSMRAASFGAKPGVKPGSEQEAGK